jgi:hypothetical protein
VSSAVILYGELELTTPLTGSIQGNDRFSATVPDDFRASTTSDSMRKQFTSMKTSLGILLQRLVLGSNGRFALIGCVHLVADQEPTLWVVKGDTVEDIAGTCQHLA